MDFSDDWNKEKYKKYIEFLLSIQDVKYRDFHKSLVLNSKYEMIGIPVPVMRDIAKQIAKTDIEAYLGCIQDKYYEEVLIQGLVISHIKEESTFYKYFKEFIKKIDNWAICDSFCSSLKIVRKHEDKYFKEAIKLSLDKKEFISRVGLVIILNHFVKQEYLNTIFDTLNKIDSDLFYINMAEAWLVCEIYIKYPDECKAFIVNNKLNNFTQNKVISKIRDSFRVSKEDKEMLKKYKR